MRIGAIAFPAAERQCLHLAEAERKVDLVNQHRDIDVAFLRPRCLVLDKGALGGDRALAPDDNHAFCRVELGFDHMAPLCAAADLRVPPDRIAVGFQRLDKRFHPTPVFRLVRDEHVAHPRGPPASNRSL